MKYWRGYLVAAIIAAFTFALEKFAQAHTALVDMFYPYVSRMMQTFLAQWSAGADFCVWQVLLVGLGILVLLTAVLMIIFKWNPIQWLGWILAGVSVVYLLNTGIYGLNQYAGSIAEDIRLNKADYTVSELQAAAEYFRDEANALADEMTRDEQGDPVMPDFETLAQQAGEGFQRLTHEEFYSVFAGSVEPVKKLGWSGWYTAKKVSGKTVGLTGEAAVNPQVPGVYLPFAMCEQMARRMCIAVGSDDKFAAFMACHANSSAEFRYAGFMMAYQYCLETLQAIQDSTGEASASGVAGGANANLTHDLKAYGDFFGKPQYDRQVTDLLVSWHIQKLVLPLLQEEDVKFDPLDETQVDLSGLANAPTAGESNG